MKTLRPLIFCGCTTDKAKDCCHKSRNIGVCRCPCHFTEEETRRIISAYIHVGDEQVSGFLKNLFAKKKEAVPAHRIMAVCGHEKYFEYKLSQMAALYIMQHPCGQCLQQAFEQ